MRGNAALAAPFTVRVAYEGHALKGTHDTTEINMGSTFFKKKWELMTPQKSTQVRIFLVAEGAQGVT